MEKTSLTDMESIGDDLTFEDLDAQNQAPPSGIRRVLGIVLVVAFVTYTLARASGLL